MAKLHKYADPKAGYFIKHSFRQNRRTIFVTYQLSPNGLDFIQRYNLKDGDEIPAHVFNTLRNRDMLSTGGTGAGEALEDNVGSVSSQHPDQSSFDPIGVNPNELTDEEIWSRVLSSNKFTREEISKHRIQITAARRRKRFERRQQQNGDVNRSDHCSSALSDKTGFRGVEIDDARAGILRWEMLPYEGCLKQLFEMADPHQEYAFLRRVWRYFEFSGMASYRNASEYNEAIGRLMALAVMMQLVSKWAYDGTFQNEEVQMWGEGLPLIRSELNDRFGSAKEDWEHWPYDYLVSHVFSEVFSSLEDYYAERLGNTDQSLSTSLIDDLREVFTSKASLDHWHGDDEIYQETGYTARELDTQGWIDQMFYY